MFRRVASLAWLLLFAASFAGCKPQGSGEASATAGRSDPPSEVFLRLMNEGKNHLDQGDATNALAVYRRAQALVPHDPDVHLNLANAHLLAGQAAEAVREAADVLKLDPSSPAAYFVQGSAYLRLGNPLEAVKALENARILDPTETATCFQLGRARMELQQWEAAITAFREGMAIDPNRLHTTPRYLLAQSLLHAGRTEEGRRELEQHQANVEVGGPPIRVATFERSRFTQARVPFKLAQPDPAGVSLRFLEATREVLGENAGAYSGPIGVLDPAPAGGPSLLVLDQDATFRVLTATQGQFRASTVSFPAVPGRRYARALVGDLQNDRVSDIIVLGDQGSHVFSFGTNGQAIDASVASGLNLVKAADGILMDLDFTGKLDLLTVGEPDRQVRIHRQFGPLAFHEITRTSGIPATLRPVSGLVLEDWTRDGNLDVLVSRPGAGLLLLEKQRGGLLVARDLAGDVPGAALCSGDFDNDLRPDAAVAGEADLTVWFHGGNRRIVPRAGTGRIDQLVAVDYDNDGWLDLVGAGGSGVRVWRNRGLLGFEERTGALGLEALDGVAVAAVRFVDLDGDCDSDLLVALAGGGLRYFRNEGGDAHGQVKVHLLGNRSNASGIGCKIEIQTGELRLVRTVQQLPIEIGVGRYPALDSFLVHWSNLPQGSAGVPVNCRDPIVVLEVTLQEGSCPYLYAWDGTRFRFVTDILGAAPLGLPVAEGRYVEADPEEFVWLGDETLFQPREGQYEVRITEELREVLYLDQARLVVVDHEPDSEVHPTDKLLPSGPFPPGTLMTLRREQPLQRAEQDGGVEVTAALRAVDGHRVSPPRLRVPQLRGLAEPHGLILDFGPLEVARPWVLVLNGWLRFGGGMANIAASHDPSLPFPFPTLDAEVAPGVWRPVAVTVGAPAGKTKTILVDLEGKLEPGTRRLRLNSAFEIHWDRIALLEKAPDAATRLTFLTPTTADLRFRGFSALEDLPPDWPLTPDYDRVSAGSPWTIVPGGWCTRYGEVRELVTSRDEGLVLVHAGDELSLGFALESVPPRPPGTRRQFFLHADGWDKDSDFHVAAGTRIEPLPFHGMNDQAYGREVRPPFPSDDLHRRYNLRWVEGTVLRRAAAR